MGLGDITQIEIFDRTEKDNAKMFKISNYEPQCWLLLNHTKSAMMALTPTVAVHRYFQGYQCFLDSKSNR